MSVLWVASFGCSILAGAAIVAALVAAQPYDIFAFVASIAAALSSIWFALQVSAHDSQPSASLVALAFGLAGFSVGYRIASSLLVDAMTRLGSRKTIADLIDADCVVVLLSDADPGRYSPCTIAARLARYARTGVAEATPAILPLIFFAERTRYRAIRGPHPARHVIDAIAKAVHGLLDRQMSSLAVIAAFVDSRPTLADVMTRVARPSSSTVIVCDVGASGSLPYLEARANADEQALGTPHATAQSMWRDTLLAERLCQRIVERMPADEIGSCGVVLLGSGIPLEWHRQSARWIEDETYFLNRTTMLLAEAGIARDFVKHAWMDWQSPTLTEAVRHIAALGSSRIVIAPATIVYPDLATMLDLDREIRAARIPEHVRTVLLTPWGDDQALVSALAASVESAIRSAPG